MNNTPYKAAAGFLLFVGALLILEGVWGLVSDEVFGFLTINKLRAVIHLGLGIGAIVAARRGRPLGYLTSLGGLLLVVAVLWSLPVTKEWMTNLLAINQAGAIYDFVLAFACLMMGSASGVRVEGIERKERRRRGRSGVTPA